MPFATFKAEVLTCFSEKEAVLFKYGQKQDAKEFHRQYGNILKDTQVDVALAVEMSVNNRILLVSKEGFKSTQFYPLFDSQKYGNLIIRGFQACSVLVPGSSRICLYNTSQHVKGRYSYLLSASETPGNNAGAEGEGSGRNVKSLIHDSVRAALIVIEGRVFPAIEASRLRAEVYFSLTTCHLEEMKKRLASCLKAKVPSVLIIDSYCSC